VAEAGCGSSSRSQSWGPDECAIHCLFGPARRAALALGAPSGPVTALAVGLPQHPDQHGPKGPVLLAVDQGLGEGATLRVAPELADPVGSLEVGQHQDVEQFGAGSGKGTSPMRRGLFSRDVIESINRQEDGG